MEYSCILFTTSWSHLQQVPSSVWLSTDNKDLMVSTQESMCRMPVRQFHDKLNSHKHVHQLQQSTQPTLSASCCLVASDVSWSLELKISSAILPNNNSVITTLLASVTEHLASNLLLLLLFLRAGVQPTMDPCAKATLWQAHWANPGGGSGWWCVRVCAWLKDEEGLSRREQLVRYL